MTTEPLQPDPAPQPDELERDLAALSSWDGPLPSPAPWERADEASRSWRTKIHRPMPWVSAIAAVLILAVVFAGVIPTMRAVSQRGRVDNHYGRGPGFGGGGAAAGNFGHTKDLAVADPTNINQQNSWEGMNAKRNVILEEDKNIALNQNSGNMPSVTGGIIPESAPAKPASITPGGLADLRTPAAPASAGASTSATEIESGSRGQPPAATAQPAIANTRDADRGETGTGEPRSDQVGSKAKSVNARAVVHRATLDMLVDDVRASVDRIAALIDPKSTEFIEQQAIVGDDRKPETLTGTLVLRIQPERMDIVLPKVRALGRVTTDTSSGEDVTALVVDLSARLRNERRVEEELLKLIDDRKNDKLDDVMKARESLKTVRETIERYQAQSDQLSKQIALATITISLRHAITEPPEPVVPTAKTQIQSAAENGKQTLTSNVAGLVEFIIAGTVWWVLIALILLGAWLISRRLNKLNRAEPPPAS